MKTIYERSVPGTRAVSIAPHAGEQHAIPAALLRAAPAELPECAEGEIVRHYTALSQRNFSVDTHFYPLGSCTMKYNPKACEKAAGLPGLTAVHPLWAQLPGGEEATQGCLQILECVERWLCEITGMSAFTLQPLAGSHGEWTGVSMMAAYHRSRGHRKTHLLIPDSAHGTNPASAALSGYAVVTVPSDRQGTMDLEAYRRAVNEETAGLMLTCPNTLGVFNPRLREIAEAMHAVDGLLYYDGANLNALLGRCKPGRMGFDVCHLNLHKTFATPHGGGGPGAGPVGVVEKLRPFLPTPRLRRDAGGLLRLDEDAPQSIGPVAPFYGNFGILVRALAYLLMVGGPGLRAVGGAAVLHANYLLAGLRDRFSPAAPGRCMHECVFSGQSLTRHGLRTLDLGKALIDRGIHPPTVYFPLNVPEALMIEPTETETKATLDRFVSVMCELADLAETDPAALRAAPRSTPVGRLDEVAAAREMNLVWSA